MRCPDEIEPINFANISTINDFLNVIQSLSTAYGIAHKYICIAICIFGCIANILHVMVLSRPIMEKFGINRLIRIIAVCDIVKMLSYSIFLIRFSYMTGEANPYEPGWIIYLIFHVVMSKALHAITLYLWATTAFIRYASLKSLNGKWNDKNIACITFCTTFTTILFLCIPTLLVYFDHIVEVGLLDGKFLFFFEPDITCFVFHLNLWLTGIFFKMIPCLLLLIFTLALFHHIKRNRERRKYILSGFSQTTKKTEIKLDRTTMMLVVLLSIFLATELPQGILAIMNALFPSGVQTFIYMSLGEILDLLSLINCNACFVLYPIMSSVYRKNLKKMLRIKTKSSLDIKPEYKSLTVRSPSKLEIEINKIGV